MCTTIVRNVLIGTESYSLHAKYCTLVSDPFPLVVIYEAESTFNMDMVNTCKTQVREAIYLILVWLCDFGKVRNFSLWFSCLIHKMKITVN